MPPPCSSSFEKASLAHACGVTWATARTDDGKTSSGTIEPPKAASESPSSRAIGPACCSVEHSAPRSIPAPVPTRQKARTTAVEPSGSPQPTEKNSDEPDAR